MNNILVIGAGPAGMMSAIAASDGGARVTILEAGEKSGRKLLASGNGRCNISNEDPDLTTRYHGEAFAAEVFSRFSQADTVRFFNGCGLALFSRDGYLYPRSLQASSVSAVLSRELGRRKIRVRCNTPAEKIFRIENSGKIGVSCGGYTYEADAVILACGSKASPLLGGRDDGYRLAASLDHRITPLHPALCFLRSEDPFVKACAPERSICNVTLKDQNGKILGVQSGQLQWSESGVSGIPAFNLSRELPEQISSKAPCFLHINWAPGIDEKDLSLMLHALPARDIPEDKNFLCGIVPAKCARALFTLCKKEAGADPEKMTKTAVRLLYDTVIPVYRNDSFKEAQICRGGVCRDDIYPETLESKLFSGLYFAGEVIDVDGPCGGYNLQWAWSSGALAGRSAALRHQPSGQTKG